MGAATVAASTDRSNIMSTWNVVAVVIELVDADTAEDAQRVLDHRLERAGFDLYTPDDPTSVDVTPVEVD